MVFSAETKRKAQYWAKRLECPVDENAGYHNTYWCNRDLIPIPPDRQTYNWQNFAGYWVIAGINTTAWTSGSSLLALGLSVPQAMELMVGVSLISALIAVVAGWPGLHQHLGFTVLCRASWGMRGGFWPVLNRIMTAIIWLGIQLYWGGQSVKIILGAIIGPKFVFMKNTLPESANVDTASLVSFFVFLVLFLPFLMVPPEKLIIPLRITFVTMTCTLFGILGWAIGANGGAGSLINIPSTAKGSTLSWVPWQYVSRPTTFINVLSGWSVFLSPMTGIVVSDYFLVRRRDYHIGDLYTANATSAYWGIHGFNWRGFLAWTMGIWPVLPGFARSIQGTKTGNGWDHIYDITYFYGFSVALFVYWAAHAAFPQPWQTGSSPFVLQEHAEMLEGTDESSQEEAETMGVELKKSGV